MARYSIVWRKSDLNIFINNLDRNVILSNIPMALASLIILMHPLAVKASCLDEAVNYADKICGAIESEGRETKTTGKAKIDAKTNSVLTKAIGAAGGSFSVDVTRTTFKNVTRRELRMDRSAARGCRERIESIARKEVCKSSPAPSAGNKLTILGASYGGDGGRRTCNFQEYAGQCNGQTSCDLRCNNDMCGDPWKGHDKECRVDYRCGSGISTPAVFRESTGGRFHLACP